MMEPVSLWEKNLMKYAVHNNVISFSGSKCVDINEFQTRKT